MTRFGKWATVVAGAFVMSSIAVTAQEQAGAGARTPEAIVQSSDDPPEPAPVDPPAPAADETPAPPEAETPAPTDPEPAAAPAEEEPALPPVAKFVEINDAVPARFFDASATAPHADDPNRLVIAFHSGIDWATWKATDFRASTEAFSYAAAMDTISFTVEAPKGFYISRITYTQGGRGSALRTGKSAGSAQWVVGSFAAPLGVFGTTPTLKGAADLTGLAMTSVPVSITNGLFAFATPSAGAATVEVNSAEVQVYLEPLTNP
jgi:hypothetical protein